MMKTSGIDIFYFYFLWRPVSLSSLPLVNKYVRVHGRRYALAECFLVD